MTSPTPPLAQPVVLEALRLPPHGKLPRNANQREVMRYAEDYARSALAALVQPPEAPADELSMSTYPVGLIKYSEPMTALRYLAKRLREAGIDSSVADDFAGSIEFLLARRDDLATEAPAAVEVSRLAESIKRLGLPVSECPPGSNVVCVSWVTRLLATMAPTPAPQVPSEAARLVGGEAAQRCSAQDALYAKARAEWRDLWLINERNFKTPNEWFLIGVEWAATQAAATDAVGERSCQTCVDEAMPAKHPTCVSCGAAGMAWSNWRPKATPTAAIAPPAEAPKAVALPAEVIAWVKAERTRIDAVETYNDAAKAAKKFAFGAVDLGPRFALMTDTANAAHRLVGPMFEAIEAVTSPTASTSAAQPLTEARIEELAREYETSGAGLAEGSGLSSHFFCADDIAPFVRAIEAAHGIRLQGGSE